MSKIDQYISELLKGGIIDISPTDIMMDVMRSIVRDEIKKYIMQKLAQNPKIKEEFTNTLKEYMELKLRETVIMIKLSKIFAKFGVEILPDKIKLELTKEATEIFEKQFQNLIEKTL